MANRNLGLEAKIDAVVDRSSQRQISEDIEKAIEQAEGSVDAGFESRTGAGGGGGGNKTDLAMLGIQERTLKFQKMSAEEDVQRNRLLERLSQSIQQIGQGAGGAAGPGGAGAAGGAGFLSRTGAGAAAKTLGTVLLGGVVAHQMLQAMMAASGRLKATATILGTAKDVFFKPFGDFLGELLRPTAKALLSFALGFNKNVSPVLIDAANAITGAIGSGIESMKDALSTVAGVFSGGAKAAWEAVFGPWPGWGSIIDAFPNWVGGIIDAFPSWDEWVDGLGWTMFVPALTWTSFIDDIAWAGFVSGVKLTNFVTGTDLNAHVVAADLQDFVTSVDLGAFVDDFPGWPDVSLPDNFWPDLSGFDNAISGVQSALRDFIRWANNLPGVNIKVPEDDTGDDTPQDPCAGVNCPPGTTCIEGRCVDTGTGGCTHASDCPPGQVCRGGTCVPSEAGGLQHGGIVTQGTSFVAGEAGDEAVLPLDALDRRLQSAFESALQNVNFGGGGGGQMTIKNQLALNGIRLTEGITQELDAKSSTVSGR